MDEQEKFEEKALSRMSQNPNARKLRQYWTTGAGGAKIGWNTGGDFTRCVRHLRKYLAGSPSSPEEVCANYHKLMTGMWPGDSRNKSDDYDDIRFAELQLYIETLKKEDMSSIINILGTRETKENT